MKKQSGDYGRLEDSFHCGAPEWKRKGHGRESWWIVNRLSDEWGVNVNFLILMYVL